MTNSSELVAFIRDLAEHLALGTELDLDEIGVALEGVQNLLVALHEQYEKPAPEGAEVIREFMLEAIGLVHGATEEIFNYFEDEDSQRLTQAVLLVEEGDDILSSIEYVIEQNQQWMSQFSVG